MTFPLPLAAISFPNIDPVAVSLGPVDVHWYGLGYVVGLAFAYWFARRLVGNERLWAPHSSPIRRVEIEDFLVWAAVGVVVGGRLGYVLFYNAPYYLANPADIVAIWDGGMSFHGGALGVIAAMILYARHVGFSAYSLMDVISVSSCVGIGVVRVANFVNAELYGRPTDVSWGVMFPRGDGTLTEPRHPSQLYEAALEGALLFAVLCVLIYAFGKLRQPGFIGGAWVFGYGAARIFVEFFRQPDAHIGYLYADVLGGEWFTRGMTLSIPMLLIGAWGMATASRRTPWRRAEPDPAQQVS